jgi:hypothetical protein
MTKKMVTPKMLFQQPSKMKVFDANQILLEHVHAITFKLQGTTYEPNFQQIEGKCNLAIENLYKKNSISTLLIFNIAFWLYIANKKMG